MLGLSLGLQTFHQIRIMDFRHVGDRVKFRLRDLLSWSGKGSGPSAPSGLGFGTFSHVRVRVKHLLLYLTYNW